MSDDLGLARIAEGRLHLVHFVGDDLRDALRPGKDIEQIEDLLHDVPVLATILSCSRPVTASETITVVAQAAGREPVRTRCAGVGTRKHFLDQRRAPGPPHQADLGFGRRRRGL
ncbi:hypothetical protein [Jeongeupia sp. USM3]|uniref:hypothetical protein n=1 Tax=Jeongeupia sp. USM3 TaxID=1906741 RepID=UPI001F3CDAEF|nr:hypothetical protein [Jeongeupia sp. USM3]